jgi:DNA-binding NtrC family response regulator
MDYILVIDDEVGVCWAIAAIARGEGWPTLLAQNGKDACEIIENHSIRMAFIDIKLPDIDGFELAKIIKKKHANLPVVFISAFYSLGDRAVEERLSIESKEEFISKPFRNSKIREAISLFAGQAPGDS